MCLFVFACTCLPVIQQCEDLLAGRTARRCDDWAAARLEQLGDEAGPQQRGDLGRATVVSHGYHGDPLPRGGPVRLCHHGPVGRLPRCWIWRRCAGACRCLPLQDQFAVLDPSAPSLLARCRGAFTPTSRHSGAGRLQHSPPTRAHASSQPQHPCDEALGVVIPSCPRWALLSAHVQIPLCASTCSSTAPVCNSVIFFVSDHVGDCMIASTQE